MILACSLRITVFTKPPSYGWKLVSAIEENILIYESNKLIPREEQQNETECICGRPEQEVWTFKALKSGITNINMEYNTVETPYSKAINTFKVNVIVK